MDPNLFFQKCKQQYWDKLNEVKTPWVLVYYWIILNQEDPNFFLFVLLELWFVYHFPRFLQFFDVGAQS